MSSKYHYLTWSCVSAYALWTALACTGGTGGDRENEIGSNGGSTDTASANAANAATGTGTTGGFNVTELSPDCGNGSLQDGEQCDDGNDLGGDGCNIACQLELDWDCPVAGQPCVSTVACGNAVLSSVENCDDGNTVDGDGCSADCSTVEPGWQCRAPGKACVPLCGDQMLTGGENCDDGNATGGDGCSSTCLTEPGWSCEGTVCTQSLCGNGLVEAGESCDAGEDNGLFYGDGTGCSKTCTQEPQCREGGATTACSTSCGDGNIDIADGETCDDGNAVDADGCSSTCQDEAGFTCTGVDNPDTQPCSSGSGECLVVPIIYRDFDGEQAAGGHPDFFYLGTGGRTCVPNASGQEDPDPISNGACWDSDSTDLCQGLVAGTLAADGKPQLGTTTTCKCRFTDWDGTNILTNEPTCDSGGAAQPQRVEENVPVIASAASFAQWYNEDTSVNTQIAGTLELEAIGGNRFQFSSSDGNTVYDDIAGGAGSTLESGFFPLENETRTKVCNIWPYWVNNPSCVAETGGVVPFQWDPALNNGGGGEVQPITGIERNFYFTTEVRYLFRYTGDETLEFFGDDDVWVFINGVLALDLGAPHERLAGDVTLSTGAWNITAVNPVDQTETPIANGTTPNLGLEAGRIYEIAVFHADRHPRESNYQLTLSSFPTTKSECVPTCGDGVVTTGEECDEGAYNADGVYGGCTTQCKWGPFCGDSVVDEGYEACDLGRDNRAQYGEEGCTSACAPPSHCGDGLIDSAFGEQCDDGPNNGVGQCNSDCTIQVR